MPSASSSEDLLRARALAIRLTSSSPAETASPQPATRYVRFAPLGDELAPGHPPRPVVLTPPEAAAAPGGPAVPPRPFVPEVGETRSHRLERFLSWCGEVCDTPVVLVMDSYALLIGTRGPLTQEQAEGLGAHLMVALETAGRMLPDGTAAQAIAVAFDSLWLTGFRATLAGDEGGTFGVSGARSPDAAARDLVAQRAGMAL